MPLYFITGNQGKFDEVKTVLPNIEQLDIDLPEIQDIDSHKVIEEKTKAALKYKSGDFIVEDNSLTINGMNGLPGPFIKWFLKSIGNEGLVKLANQFGSVARAKVVIGYTKEGFETVYFEGVLDGKIVDARGENGFGWDPVFEPIGFNKTFAEMTAEEKNSISMRRAAVEKLNAYLSLN